MLKVMVVEDEDIVRDEIKHMIDWQRHGFALIGEACNGREGLRLCAERNPDIIISDIKMPVLGGLEMTTGIKRSYGNKEVILLTSYGDFDFAREALKLGIHSYVLKHELDSDMLIDELNKARRRIEAEESMDGLARRERLRMFLKRIMSLPEDGAAPDGDPLPWRGRTGALLLGLDRMPAEPQRQLPVDEAIERSGFVDFLYAGPFKEFEAEAADLNGSEYAIFYRIPEPCSEKRLYEYGWTIARLLQSAIRDAYGRTATVAIGPAFESGREIGEALRRTGAAYALKTFRASGSILAEPLERPADAGTRQAAIGERLTLIRERLAAHAYEEARELQRELFTRLLPPLHDAALLRKCMYELVSLINRDHGRGRRSPVVDPVEKLAELQQLDNVFQIADWFDGILVELAEEANSNISPKIREVLQYIHANYQHDITLNEVADRLGLSLIYTSQLFKKEVGIPLVAYIAKCRIDRARELLETGNYKVHEVSAMVGYQTVQYFCKTYKRLTGRNPGDR